MLRDTATSQASVQNNVRLILCSQLFVIYYQNIKFKYKIVFNRNNLDFDVQLWKYECIVVCSLATCFYSSKIIPSTFFSADKTLEYLLMSWIRTHTLKIIFFFSARLLNYVYFT